MAISPVSPMGNTSYYSSFRADKTPPDTTVPEKNTSPRTGVDKQSIDEDTYSTGDQTQVYGYTYPGAGTGKPSATEEDEPPQSKSLESEQENVESSESAKTGSHATDSEYTPEEEKQITELQARDTEVKAHEQAHIAAGGRYVRGGAHFKYQTGPDGERYAVGGEVSIDVSKDSGDPQATVAKMQTIIRAAMAPASPSAQDRAVAAQAARIEMEARSEAMTQAQSEAKGETKQTDPEAQTESRGADAYPASMDTPPATPHIDLYT